ncbi:type II secretion system F family protein [Deferribacterales bacterium Es71-Z0220]|uniref:type II secretion system F family protein n=1 Tax=Deferrivibrio essentukiensis TaxID=2880922 RepID=UPI001F607E10|nr:type II secretion system F family protein [Deferrivibrio essentukiensis]MCB4204761.1 type II secretion system F family protein [Deferrivibrio essentukiensis]
MPIYSYKGISTSGKKISGTLEANSRSALIMALKEQGVFAEEIIEVTERKGFDLFDFSFLLKKRLPDIFFQIATLLKSGIVLTEAFKIIGNQQSSRHLKRILLDISSKLSGGEKLSTVLENYKNLFSDTHISIIRASESIGRLAESLENMGRYEEDRRKSIDKIKLAMIYPLIVLSVGLGVVGFLLAYVVPKMENVFVSVNRKLPLSTEILINAGNFIKNYGYLLMFFLTVIFISFRFILKNNKKLKLSIDRRLSKFKIIENINLYRFCETMSFLLKEGVMLVSAIEISTNTIKSEYYKGKLKEVAFDVKMGKSFSQSIMEKGCFSEIIAAAIKTGEKSGNLPGIFERLSSYYLKRLEKVTNIFLSTVEPMFILFLGLVVGFIVISIMSPLFELNTLVK